MCLRRRFGWTRWCLAIGLVLSWSVGLHAQTEFAAGQLPRDQLPKSRALDYEFDEVRIATILGWLRRVSIEPPVALTGTVSGWLWAQSPTSGWWRIGDYRVEGEITSPLLGVDRFAIRQARVRFGYQQGLWTVGPAEGQIEAQTQNDSAPQTDPQRPGKRRSNEPATRSLGQANFSATLPTNTQDLARIQGQLGSVELASLLQTFGLTENLPSGQASSTLRMDTSLTNLSNPLRWNARGQIAISQLQYGTLAGVSAQSDWTLSDAALNLANTRLTLPGAQAQSIALAASMDLQAPFAWQAQLPSQQIGLTPALYQELVPTSVPRDNLPYGIVQLVGTTSGTLQPWQAQYSLDLASRQLDWFDNRLANLQASLTLDASGLALNALNFQTAGGSLSGAANFSGNVDQPFTLKLNYRGIDLSAVRAPVPLPIMTGRVSGQLQLAADKRQLTEVQSIDLTVTGNGQGVRIGDWGLGNIEYAARKPAGQDTVEIDLQDASPERKWLADGQLVQRDDQVWRYVVDARGNGLDLSVPQLIRLIGTDPQLPVPLEFVLVTGNIKLLGDTRDGLDTTEFNFSNITTLERDRRIWAQGSMVGRTTRHLVEIQRSQWQVGNSQIHAALRWNYLLQDQPAGEVLAANTDFLKLNVQDLQLESLEAWRILTLPVAKDGRKPLHGMLSGDVDLQRPAGAVSWLTDWRGQVRLELSQLSLNDTAAGQVKIVGDLGPDHLEGQITGDVLGAPLAGNVRLTLQQAPRLRISDARGEVSWLGAEVSRLMTLWQARGQAAHWRGLANVRAQFDWPADGAKSGQAQVEVLQLSYRQRTIIRSLQAVAELDNQRLRLVRFSGGLGGGRVDLTGGLDLTTGTLDGITVQLQRVSLAELAQLIDPDWEQELDGRADVRARVHVRRGLDVHGDLRLHDATWIGLPIDELHAGFELSSPLDWSVVRLHTSNARGRLFGGRAEADLQARFGSRNAMDLRLRVNRGEVDQLSEWTGTSSVVGRGKFDAALTLASNDLRSTRDLRGVLDLTFEDTNARTLPVADQLARFVPLFAVPSTEFERGRLSANISQGDLRMRSLALWGRQLSVLGSGNIGMTNGRLDLQLVIRTGGGLSQLVAANYLSQLAATAIPEVELLLQINRLIANRAIFLRVAGTASKPVIQPQAAQMIERALVRSLLEQAAAIGPATAALGVTATSQPD